ncbi:hypothetical protein COU20_03050 [Candidatus Kaiserbacteria bacterium CG10_big_fil_rev_8_21_14_0_10_59_10]|uniref:Uncharacterized protein n=1 Tax=Candidatus Kaiserbacteria bacterium CG10_big_fil_rev_8_21_14_0_10_59_10 TaxID=1974612 RepID=A0A2H0U7D2_9BACT|nr:MAG: hypothetical protein COU20_03050 [Candidatus Kaiserbacteria bacterium CG10_big_fil_rev_8_21_14_0_10_59_10]
MELSIYLAQLLGLYFVLVGAIVLLRQKSLTPLVNEFAQNRALLFSVAVIELAAGLAILLAHPIFEFTWQGVITFIGALLVAESLVYLMMPYPKVGRFIRQFNTATWLRSGALIAIVFGAYLAGVGFGFI